MLLNVRGEPLFGRLGGGGVDHLACCRRQLGCVGR